LEREGFIATSVDAFRADICGYTVRAKAAVFGLLGWNSYGTEGRNGWQRFGSPNAGKWLELTPNRCHRLPPAAVWITW